MKKALITILLCLSATLGYAQQSRNIVYEITDFHKMLQSAVNPFVITEDGAIEARNVRAGKIYGSLAKREAMLLYGTAGSYPIKSLYRYYLAADTKFLIATGSTYLMYGNDDTGVFTTLRDQMSSGKRWQFVTYFDQLIGFNGTDNPQKWDGETQTTANTDGSRTASLLTADLGAPFAEQNTGSNLTASRYYQYRIAYYDGSTYYYSTARSNPLLTGSTVRDITLTDIPLGPSGTTQRIIYRTVGNTTRNNVEADNSFYRVATISDNITQTYDDTMTDATLLADTAPIWSTVSAGTNVTPPIVKHAIIHKEHLFGGNTSADNSNLYWSKAFLPDFWLTDTDYDKIRPDDGDEITFLRSILGILAVGKTNTIQKYITDNSDTTLWYSTDPFSFVGCPAPYTARNSPLGIIYLARDGIYIFNGENSQLASEVVKPEIEDISPVNIENAVAVYFGGEYHLAYTSKRSGSAVNDSVLLLDTVKDAYVIDDKNIDSMAVLDSGSDFGTIYSGTSLSTGKVEVFSSSPSNWINRYRSDLEAGTTDSTVIYGLEDLPYLEIGWGVTIDTTTLAGQTINGYSSTAIIDRPSTTGYWYSDVVQINASQLNKLYWNEDLGESGHVYFSVRTAATEGGITAAAWSSEKSDPNGSDVSGVSANDWVQLRARLTTGDITESPLLFSQDNFVIKLSYQKEGSSSEDSVLSIWNSGWDNLGVQYSKKRIKAIEIHYTGTDGDLTFNLKNSEGDIDTSFDIDLSVLPNSDSTDAYTGNATDKIYTWNPPLNSSSDPTPIGEFWQFRITEDGTTEWKINRVKILADVEEIYE